jgi:hypothetical protein
MSSMGTLHNKRERERERDWTRDSMHAAAAAALL